MIGDQIDQNSHQTSRQIHPLGVYFRSLWLHPCFNICYYCFRYLNDYNMKFTSVKFQLALIFMVVCILIQSVLCVYGPAVYGKFTPHSLRYRLNDFIVLTRSLRGNHKGVILKTGVPSGMKENSPSEVTVLFQTLPLLFSPYILPLRL